MCGSKNLAAVLAAMAIFAARGRVLGEQPLRTWSFGALVNMLDNSPRQRPALARLAQAVPSSFPERATLDGVFQRVQRGTEVRLHVDWDGLRAAGLQRSTAISVEETGLSYERYLDALCAQLSVTLVLYYREPGIFWLTTREACPPEVWAKTAAAVNGGPGDDLDSPEDRVVGRKLQATVRRFAAEKQGLEQVIASLRAACQCNIEVNWTALQGAGIEKNTPVSVNLTNVPVRKILTTVLSDVGGGAANLGFTIDEGVVEVSTRDDLNSAKYDIVRVYDIRGLVAARGLIGGRYDTQVQRLVDLIKQTIAPESWRDAGGAIGSIRVLNDRMIVNQTRENHIAIGNLLRRYRGGYAGGGDNFSGE